MKNWIILIAFLTNIFFVAQTIEKFSLDSGGVSTAVGNLEVLYTMGEVFVSENTVSDIALSEGFINPQQLIIKLNSTVFLQGAYNSGSMIDDLRNSKIIPTTTPYADGISCNLSVFNVTGNNAIIDWVWLELRDESDGKTVIASTSALLQADGDVVAVDGISPLTIDIPTGNYYLMISHRNHLGIITANPVSLSGGVFSIDFTSNSALVTGGTNAIKELGDGNFALFAGDFNGDGQIQNTDKSAVEPLRGISGYSNADIDMNGEVQNTDINNLLSPNLGKGEQFLSKKLNAKRNGLKKN